MAEDRPSSRLGVTRSLQHETDVDSDGPLHGDRHLVARTDGGPLELPLVVILSELLIERHLATLLGLPGDGELAPMPSLRLIQAPVYHGYSFSAWVEFEANPGVEALESSFAVESIDVRGAEFEPPTNFSQAGQGGISVGAIALDRNHPEACWFWFVADNLRLAAENAVAVARQLV